MLCSQMLVLAFILVYSLLQESHAQMDRWLKILGLTSEIQDVDMILYWRHSSLVPGCQLLTLMGSGLNSKVACIQLGYDSNG
jgi:hypothetical protein